jgi:uncharacterized protein
MRTLALCLIATLPFAAQAEDNKPATLTVRGEAVTKVTPDQVSLPVTVREESANLKVAKERHDEKLRTLLKLAKDTGIAEDKTRTNYTSVNPQYDYTNDTTGKPRLRGYEVQTSVEFTLTDISKLGKFMSDVVEAGIENVGSVNYSLQDEDKTKQATLTKALEHAHDKAAQLADAAHVSLEKPLLIEEGDAQMNRPIFPPRPMPMMRGMAVGIAATPAMAPVPPELPSGLIEIHQSVTVTYQIK